MRGRPGVLPWLARGCGAFPRFFLQRLFSYLGLAAAQIGLEGCRQPLRPRLARGSAGA
jgi:hypothetical protein